MMPRPLWLLPLVLMGCSGPTVAPGPLSAVEQACAAQIDDDPAVRETRAISAGRLVWEWQHKPEIDQIKRDAMTRCLRARGQISRGGVERPR